VNALAWSPDGTRLATGSDDETVRIWSVETGKQTARLRGHADEVAGVAWAPDGDHLTSVDRSGLVIVWDGSGRQVASVVLQPSECLAWSTLIAVGQPGRPALLEFRKSSHLVGH
jgi:WD40 repeat protein